MIVPFTQRPASPNEPVAPQPTQAQLLMAAAEMHGKGLLGSTDSPDDPPDNSPASTFKKLAETKPKRGRR